MSGAGTIGKISRVPKGVQPGVFNQALIRIRLNKEKTDNNYFLQLMRSPKMQRKLTESNPGSAMMNLVPMSEIKKWKLLIPNLNEQIKLGEFINWIDKTIELHQRNNQILGQIKKAYLQKMFTQKNKYIPSLRFNNFSETWERNKARELFQPIVEKNQPELSVLSVTQEHGVVYRDKLGIDIKYDLNTLKNYKVVHPEDFIISLRSFQGGFELSDKNGIVSPAYTVFISKSTFKSDSKFWKFKFKSYNFIQSLKTVTFGIRDGKSISFSEFGSLNITYPSNIEEQEIIGFYFNKMNKIIELHQSKIDKLLKLKETYLHKMFL